MWSNIQYIQWPSQEPINGTVLTYLHFRILRILEFPMKYDPIWSNMIYISVAAWLTSLDFNHSPRNRKRLSVMGDVAQAAPATAEGEVIEQI